MNKLLGIGLAVSVVLSLAPARPPPEDRAAGLRSECEHVRDRLDERFVSTYY